MAVVMVMVMSAAAAAHNNEEREMFPDQTEATREEINAAVTQWRAVRTERLALEKEANKVRERETALKDFIIGAMQAQKYEGTICEGRQTYVRTTEVPNAEDRLLFSNYILMNGALELLQFRPAVGALKELRDAGVEVPGIAWVEVYDLGDKQA